MSVAFYVVLILVFAGLLTYTLRFDRHSSTPVKVLLTVIDVGLIAWLTHDLVLAVT